ncbi:hypothetical protein JCM3770_003246 [Rhodotorula araucariae]
MHDAPSAHQGLAFSLSRLLAEKMAMKGFVPGLHGPPTAADAARGPGGTGGTAGPAWLIQRCPKATLAQLDEDGGCFCGKLDADATLCHGHNENDRRAICVEDLRDDAQREGHQGKITARGGGEERASTERSKRRRATCGLEFREGFEPASRECPVGYARVGEDDSAPFICQDTASPYSCGKEQVDCYAQPGVLRAVCSGGGCEIMMCREGWRFHMLDPDEEMGFGSTSCVPSKPLFLNSAV